MKADDDGGYDMRGSTGTGSAGFVAGSNVGVLKSVSGTRYQAVVSENARFSEVRLRCQDADGLSRIPVLLYPCTAVSRNRALPTFL